jgi:hypothetical protein
VVRHCSTHGDDYAIGFALNDETKATFSFEDAGDVDSYAFL